ncbi:MAG: OsmC family protein [bacterium]
MANKQVEISASLGEGFKTECQAREHSVIIDQSEAGGGENAGPSPLEYMLFSLAGCISAIGRIIAKQEKLPLRGMEIKVGGELNTAGLLGKETDDRIGFQDIRASVDIDADMSTAEKENFLEKLNSRCPISDNIANETPVSIELA